jgi:hypothetical protein
VAESVGLCARCAFASPQAGARGSRFWRCRRADADPAFARYPALPVLRCPGFEAGAGLTGGDATAQPPARERARLKP